MVSCCRESGTEKVYARGGWVMRGETTLCALRTSYPRWNNFIRAQNKFSAFKAPSTQTFYLLRYFLKDPSKLRCYTFDRIFAIL